MATQEEIIKLVMQVQGQAEADALRVKMAALREDLLKLGTAAGGTVSPQMIAMGTQFKALGDQATELDRKFGRASSGLAGMGQSFLQTGRVVQDFTQGGIAGVLNNIEGLTQAMGGGAGLAGILTVVGVAALAAGPYLASLAKSMGLIDEPASTATTMIGKLQEKIKTLGEKAIKLPVDMAQLDEAKKKLAELEKAKLHFDELMGLESKHEKESKAQTAAIMGEAVGGSKAATVRMEKVAAKRIDESDPALIAAQTALSIAKGDLLEVAKQKAADPNANPFEMGQREAKAKAAIDKAKGDIENATKANQAQARLQVGGAGPAELAGLLGETGNLDDRNTADKLRKATPEALKAKEESLKQTAELKEAVQKGLDDESTALKGLKDAEKEQATARKARWDKLAGSLAKNARAEFLGSGDIGEQSAAGMLQLMGERDGPETVRQVTERAKKSLDDEVKKHAADNRMSLGAARADLLKKGQPKVAGDKGKSEAKRDADRIAGTSNLDEQAQTFLAMQEARRQSIAGQTGATRRSTIRNAMRAGNPFLDAQSAERMATEEIARQMTKGGAVDETGRPMSSARINTTASAMMRDIRAKRGQAGQAFANGGFRNIGMQPIGRSPANGETGDTGKKAAEDNTKATERLTEAIVMQIQNGVRLQLGD